MSSKTTEGGDSRPDTHEPGWHSLVAAICLTALQDYWTWFRFGAIRDVAITDYDSDKHHRCDVADLLAFIHTGAFSRVMEMAGVDCTTEDLLAQIRRMERDGSHRAMFGSGRGRSIKRRTHPAPSTRMRTGQTTPPAPAHTRLADHASPARGYRPAEHKGGWVGQQH